MRVLLGNDANHHQFIDIQCVDVSRTADDGRNNIRQCCVAQHVDWAVEYISVGFEWFSRSMDFIETSTNLFGRKSHETDH